MLDQRRKLLIRSFYALSFFSLNSLAAIAQRTGSTPSPPQPKGDPNAPNGNVPSGLKGPQVTPSDPRTVDRARQQELKTQVSKLYDMVAELKQQVEFSDVATTLSVSTVKKAQQIEKLAKQIKDLAKN
jgi:hypothetical protein